MQQNTVDRTRSKVGQFFTGAGLPVFLLTAVLVYEGFLLAVVFAPEGLGFWSAFSREFKVWCFRYDARTGGMEWAAFWVMVAEPLFIAATAAFLWRKRLSELTGGARWRGVQNAALSGALVAVAVVSGLFAYGRPGPADEVQLPFPGERIRTALVPPDFVLQDQRGAEVGLAALRGRVVIVTGVYALCSTSCPEILSRLKELTAAMPQDVQRQVSILALSLNPEYENTEIMSLMAEGHGFAYEAFRYLNGDVAVMNDLLTRLGFSRMRNPDTGAIEHANLFLLIDAEGRIAYRFNLETRHKGWLLDATTALAREAAAAKG